jgi:hypothetical protein
MVKRGESEQGADRGEPCVSRPRAVAALALEVVEKRGDELDVDVGEIEFGGPPCRSAARRTRAAA